MDDYERYTQDDLNEAIASLEAAEQELETRIDDLFNDDRAAGAYLLNTIADCIDMIDWQNNIIEAIDNEMNS